MRTRAILVCVVQNVIYIQLKLMADIAYEANNFLTNFYQIL